jgi:L-ribulose-5-phosphate 3-epimerase
MDRIDVACNLGFHIVERDATVLLGYNTNGLAHHRLSDAVEILSEIGYRAVAVTIDHGALPPASPHLDMQVDRLAKQLRRCGLASVVETGARYLLDPRRKHEPTLVSADAADRARRVEFYRHAIRCASELGSACVSIWSGVLRDDVPRAAAMDRLCEGLVEVLSYAAGHGVDIGFEPEPGMSIDGMDAFHALQASLRPLDLKLTLDIGHLQCQGEMPLEKHISRAAGSLINVHLDDMRLGVHEHLMFGEGEIDYGPVFRTLREVGYRGPACVELSRHSHIGPEAARRAFASLAPLL